MDQQKWPKEDSSLTVKFGIRSKLITIFILIKVIPLVILAVFAARQIAILGDTAREHTAGIVKESKSLVGQVGFVAVNSSIEALDQKSRDTIERLSADTARAVADFLYERDNDILLVADLPRDFEGYKSFLKHRNKKVVYHLPWQLNAEENKWEATAVKVQNSPSVRAKTKDNKRDFHYRLPEEKGVDKIQPLYHELTFIDLDGKEIVKVSTTDLLQKELKDVSLKENTWCKAETYFKELVDLEDGEVYVSEVVGPYLPTPIIGVYTPAKAERKGVPFAPEESGYAGKENPVGKRFQGIIRWATPVFDAGSKIGYVTLALDHTHIMEFTDHLVPTEERYSSISDASSGNYAFMWDYEGRNISHPRDYFIVGYDPDTGEPSVPWLSQELYELWKDSGLSYVGFTKMAPKFHNQSLAQKPALDLTKAGQVALDCRYLNFAPQCSGWNNLTQYGGSGSFVIFWSKLWKLNTASTIPYYTGRYATSSRGFGFVTIGANVDEFHSAASETAVLIAQQTDEYEQYLEQSSSETKALMSRLIKKTIEELTLYTLIMVILVVIVAIWMASALTSKITGMILGLKRFQDGDLASRLKVQSKDEVGQLAEAFNEMSDKVQDSIEDIRLARDRAEESDEAKGLFLANMSHEIRTPMNAIIGMSRLALEGSEDERQRKLLDSVMISADSLLAVVNDILDFSKIEADQLDLENRPFDLHKELNSLMDSLRILALDNNLDLHCDIDKSVPQFVMGDKLRLRQVLLNLLGNGVKFTEFGSVALEVRCDDSLSNGKEIVFVVRDTGVGVSKEHLLTMFDRFSQADNTVTRRHQGTGLGLAITKKLCQLMGGEIQVESKIGLGSVFTVAIDFEACSSGEQLGEDVKSCHSCSEKQEYRILLVEDNEMNRNLAQMVLSNLGHEINAVDSGLEAVKTLLDNEFDAVLMDIQMPDMDGFEATEIIRAAEQGQPFPTEISSDIEEGLRASLFGKHMKIIALTAHAMKGDRERCLEAGIDEYLTKPFLTEQVVAALNSEKSK